MQPICHRCSTSHTTRNPISGKYMAHGHYTTSTRDRAISIALALLPFILTACMLRKS